VLSAAGIGALDDLERGVELLGLGEMGDVAGMVRKAGFDDSAAMRSTAADMVALVSGLAGL
jgi:hypothetical protein